MWDYAVDKVGENDEDITGERERERKLWLLYLENFMCIMALCVDGFFKTNYCLHLLTYIECPLYLREHETRVRKVKFSSVLVRDKTKHITDPSKDLIDFMYTDQSFHS